MLTIGEVASRAGLRPSAIRYYEKQGLLPTASRKGGKRMYDASILETLSAIRLAKMAGFDLEEIRAVLSAGGTNPGAAWRKWIPAKRAAIDLEISRLALMKDVLARLGECTCATFEECGRTFDAVRRKARG